MTSADLHLDTQATTRARQLAADELDRHAVRLDPGAVQ